MNTSNIIVTGMESKAIQKRNGDTGRLFTIEANDGRKYVTWDENFYHARRVGEELTINYEVSTREWKGKTYSDYKIVTEQRSPAPSSNPSLPVPPSANEAKVINALREVYKRIESMEKNLSAQIALTMGDIHIPTEEDVYIPVEEPKATTTFPTPAEQDKMSREEIGQLTPGDIPF